MAVAYRSSSATGTSDAFVQTVNVPVPSGVAANDIILVALEMWETAGATVTVPSGFDSTPLVDHTSGNSKLKVFWKRASGADSGNYTFSWTGNQWTMGHAVAWSGCKTTGTPVAAGTVASASSTSIPTHSVTVGYSNPGLQSFVANENSATQSTVPTGFTEREDGDYLHSNTVTGSGTGTFSASSGVVATSTLILAVLLALEPASGSGLTGSAGTATETDSALSVGKTKRATTGVVSESSTARPLGRQKLRTVVAPSEVDSAVSLARFKQKSLGVASLSEVVQPVARAKRWTLGVAVETGTAVALPRAKRANLGVGVSTDTALPLSSSLATVVALSPALSTDIARPLGFFRRRAIGTAVEVSAALSASTPTTVWRLVPPLIRERWPVRGRLRVSTWREFTVFGDSNGLFLTENGRFPDGGGDDWGAIPDDTVFVWLGGHRNITSDPAVRALWLAHAHLGLTVETINVS